ncbi:hypothetical protein CSC17_1525 [Klebsiella oxytoca]|nr:hypothetical protein CSC17_1525 [Klebsiella oxytoca]EUC87943.1 hypothetical protein HMPREF1570_3776 [Klebsiella oxytoca KA-2]EUC90993.1 hypothetical protein HMPREF1569_1033 [Klebsiella oxytoca OK-1]
MSVSANAWFNDAIEFVMNIKLYQQEMTVIIFCASNQEFGPTIAVHDMPLITYCLIIKLKSTYYSL